MADEDRSSVVWFWRLLAVLVVLAVFFVFRGHQTTPDDAGAIEDYIHMHIAPAMSGLPRNSDQIDGRSRHALIK
jgi:hypothetical protein